MQQELGRKVNMQEVKDLLLKNFSEVFSIHFDELKTYK
jgi:hypothetical protein